MVRSKILIDKIPKLPYECPFAVMDSECGWGYLCNVNDTLCDLALRVPKPCECLIVPFTFEEESEE